MGTTLLKKSNQIFSFILNYMVSYLQMWQQNNNYGVEHLVKEPLSSAQTKKFANLNYLQE